VYARYIAAMTPFFPKISTLKSEKPHSPEWRLEIDELVAQHVRPKVSDEQYAHLVRTLDYNGRQNLITKYEEPVLRHVVARQERISRQQALKRSLLGKSHRSSDMTPLGFEVWCRDTLISQGWKAEITKASGDQGADITAEKHGNRVVIQCKFYTGPVANKAVQEVSTARHYYGAAYAVVICNEDARGP
jgi:HJR/Mrr/RecB family endonuclease